MSHNKKRNVGIIYELLIRAVSAYLVNNERDRAQKALNIISTHYNKNTELYKEFRLLNALAKSSVKDTPVAAAILAESKSASRRFNASKLDKEKSSLIHEINHTLADTDFYYRRVPDYKAYATIQTLLNTWREGDTSDLANLVLMETRMIEWLTTSREEEVVNEELDKNVDSLVVKLMNEKFNSKYNDKLTNDQKELIKEYVFSLQHDKGVSIAKRALEIQTDTIAEINKIKKVEKNKVILEKIEIVHQKIKELDLMEIDDSKIAKLMTLTQLMNEIRGG